MPENWIKPAACGESGHCPEVHIRRTTARIRSSQRPDEVVSFDHDEWLAFIAGAKAGEFDLPGEVTA